MAERCPTCGEPVRVVSSDEGTSHYESIARAEVEKLREGLILAYDWIAGSRPHTDEVKVLAEIEAALAEPVPQETRECEPGDGMKATRIAEIRQNAANRVPSEGEQGG